MKGKIKFFNDKKGYGFIIKEDGTDIFFHATDFQDRRESQDLQPGDDLEFDVGPTNRGVKAIKIKKQKRDDEQEV